jgi:hypothetical protein
MMARNVSVEQSATGLRDSRVTPIKGSRDVDCSLLQLRFCLLKQPLSISTTLVSSCPLPHNTKKKSCMEELNMYM